MSKHTQTLTEQDLRASNKSLLDDYNKLSDKLYRMKIILTVAGLVAAAASLVVFSNFVMKDTRIASSAVELDRAYDSIWELEREAMILRKELSFFENEDVKARDRAFYECLRQVEVSMATVTKDGFGNPLDVSDFAQRTCETELGKLGAADFIVKFPVKG